jgi:prepilin-type processing-associated H-X9-DG protein
MIELLACIAIIAVLVSLALPGFNAVRKRADQAACLSNLRQVLAATALAASENDGKYPNMHGYAWEQGDAWIADTLAPYLSPSVRRNPNKVLRCPAAQKNQKEAWLQAPQYCHYRYNIWHAQNKTPEFGYANAMLFFDTTWPNWKAAECAHSDGTSASVNIAYADGHINTLKYVDYVALNTGNEAQCDLFARGWVKK